MKEKFPDNLVMRMCQGFITILLQRQRVLVGQLKYSFSVGTLYRKREQLHN